MHTYIMQFDDDEFGPGKRIEFTALDPAHALDIARRERRKGRIELFEGARRLGTFQQMGPELWQLN